MSESSGCWCGKTLTKSREAQKRQVIPHSSNTLSEKLRAEGWWQSCERDTKCDGSIKYQPSYSGFSVPWITPSCRRSAAPSSQSAVMWPTKVSKSKERQSNNAAWHNRTQTLKDQTGVCWATRTDDCWKPVQTVGVPERNQIHQRKEKNVTSSAGMCVCVRVCMRVRLYCECQCCSGREGWG